jgi:hypothetical protein
MATNISEQHDAPFFRVKEIRVRMQPSYTGRMTSNWLIGTVDGGQAEHLCPDQRERLNGIMRSCVLAVPPINWYSSTRLHSATQHHYPIPMLLEHLNSSVAMPQKNYQ